MLQEQITKSTKTHRSGEAPEKFKVILDFNVLYNDFKRCIKIYSKNATKIKI